MTDPFRRLGYGYSCNDHARSERWWDYTPTEDLPPFSACDPRFGLRAERPDGMGGAHSPCASPSGSLEEDCA